MIIRSMYFRNEDELKQVKEFIAQIRGKQTQKIQPAPRIREDIDADEIMRIISKNPEYFTNVPKKPTSDLSVGATNVAKMPKLPQFLLDIMNGGAFPSPEDLTKAEQAILYDNQINTLVNLYRQTKKIDLANHIRERLDELGVDF